MLNSLTFHWDFCFVCGDSWQKLFLFSSAKNAGKLLCCSPNFGELPQKDLCGQLAQVLAPSPCVDLVFEKGTQGLCVCGSFINFFLGVSCIKDVVVRTFIHPRPGGPPPPPPLVNESAPPVHYSLTRHDALPISLTHPPTPPHPTSST